MLRIDIARAQWIVPHLRGEIARVEVPSKVHTRAKARRECNGEWSDGSKNQKIFPLRISTQSFFLAETVRTYVVYLTSFLIE